MITVTLELGYLAHVLIGITAKLYVPDSEVCQIAMNRPSLVLTLNELLTIHSIDSTEVSNDSVVEGHQSTQTDNEHVCKSPFISLCS